MQNCFGFKDANLYLLHLLTVFKYPKVLKQKKAQPKQSIDFSIQGKPVMISVEIITKVFDAINLLVIFDKSD